MNKQVKQFILLAVLVSILSTALTGCGTPSGGKAVEASYVESKLSRDTTADVPDNNVSAQVQGNTDFAFDLYQQLINSGDGNLFYSPHSISIALAMTYAGADGNTKAQMADVMHYELSEEELHTALNHLDQLLATRGEGAQGADDEGFRLNIVNAIWGQDGYEFLEPFLDTLAKNYGAGLRLVDYAGQTEQARQTINNWVSEQTEDRIKDLLPEGILTPLTRLVLTNAIYFNAAWAVQFNEDATQDAPFTLLDGSQVTVPMMRNTEDFGYARGDGYQVVELAYDGYEIAMDIVLPDAGTFTDFEGNLSGSDLSSMLADVKRSYVRLAMPRFEMESEFSLKETLKALGMTDAFDSGAADFSRMDGTKDLFISAVQHKSFVKVDENGTEAAAATAVVVTLESAPADEPVQVTVDHPFIFVIRDLETGAILFVGRVVNPVE